MALEMHQLQARDIPELDELEGANVVTPGPEANQVVQIARRMQGGRFVPSGLVRSTALEAPIVTAQGYTSGRASSRRAPDTALTVSMPYCSDAFPFVSTAIR